MIQDGPKKPAWGSPCNGCGVCCTAETCPVGLIAVPHAVEDGPCPALEWEDGRSWCGLIRNPEKHADEIGLVTWSVLHGVRRADLGAWMLSAIGDGECDAGPPEGEDDDELGITAWERFHG